MKEVSSQTEKLRVAFLPLITDLFSERMLLDYKSEPERY